MEILTVRDRVLTLEDEVRKLMCKVNKLSKEIEKRDSEISYLSMMAGIDMSQSDETEVSNNE